MKKKKLGTPVKQPVKPTTKSQAARGKQAPSGGAAAQLHQVPALVPGLRWEHVQGTVWRPVVLRAQMTLEEAFEAGDTVITGLGTGPFHLAMVDPTSMVGRLVNGYGSGPKATTRRGTLGETTYLNNNIPIAVGAARRQREDEDLKVPCGPAADDFVVKTTEAEVFEAIAAPLERRNWRGVGEAIKALARLTLAKLLPAAVPSASGPLPAKEMQSDAAAGVRERFAWMRPMGEVAELGSTKGPVARDEDVQVAPEVAESGSTTGPVPRDEGASVHVAPVVAELMRTKGPVGASLHVTLAMFAVAQDDKLSLKQKLEKLRDLMPPVHPVAAAYPLMSEEELAALAEDIKTNGQRLPILLTRGAIFDGRNRWLACVLAGVQPKTAEWDQQGDPIDVVRALNSLRREIAPFARAAVAVNMIPLLAQQARERQEEAGAHGKQGGRGIQKTLSNGSLLRVSGQDNSKRSVIQAAKAQRAGINATQMLLKIKETAPEVFDLALNGKATQAETKRLAALPERERKAAVARILSGEPVKPPAREPKTALDMLNAAETLILRAAQAGRPETQTAPRSGRHSKEPEPLTQGAWASPLERATTVLGEMRTLAKAQEPGAPAKPVPGRAKKEPRGVR